MRHASSLLTVIGCLWLLGLIALGLLEYPVRRHHFESAGLTFGVGLTLLAWLHRIRTDPELHAPAPEARPLGVYLVPAVIALLAFGWSISLGPLSDDFVLRTWAAEGDWTPETWGYLRPLPLALWQVLGSWGGWTALHILNILLHALNSALVGGIGSACLGPRSGIAAGVVFAMFPAAAEAVAWGAGVFDLTAAACVLIAVTVWLSNVRPLRRHVLLVLVCAAGLLSKESAIAIPALLLLITLAWAPSWLRSRGRLVSLLLTLTLGAGYLVARAVLSPALASHIQNLPDGRRQLKDLLLRPFAGVSVPMRTETGIGVDAYLGGLFLLMLIAVTVLQIARSLPGSRDGVRRASVLCIGLGWTLLSALPLLMQFYVSPTLEGSRYLYLPSAGLALAVSAAFAGRSLGWREGAAALALAGLLGGYAVRLREERSVWRAATTVRDAVLTHAAAAVRDVPCRTLLIHGAPDNVRGAFVFREGLEDALAAIPMNASGAACVLRWTGSGLIPED